VKCRCGREAAHGMLNHRGRTLYWYGCGDCDIYVDAWFMSVAILKFLHRVNTPYPDGVEEPDINYQS